jgi:NADH dehydrogenase [ubiquinone] 1 alpha subcomplex assembly factor 7
VLRERLLQLIRAEGPISVSRYMAEALLHPLLGYYTRGQGIGRAGDFVTAPEISQMFGELVGVWCVDAWTRLGQPAPFALVEFGPGRGTLLADLLRATARFPAFAQAARLHLVEASATLRGVQRAAIAPREAQWHDTLASLPALPTLAIANEFFDALPVRQFVRLADGWHERMVGLHPNGRDLAFVAAPDALPHPDLPPGAPGQVVERSPAAMAVAAQLGRHLASHGGYALIVDYGHTDAEGGATLQAVRAHERADPLTDPGQADLTTLVDFPRLARAAGVPAFGPVSQGALLQALGIVARADALKSRATPDQAAAVAAALHRLTAAEAMGTLFKALALAAPGLPAPAGFA